MGMWAVFRCQSCGTETLRGQFKGADMYQPVFPCLPCKARTNHEFVRYETIDERSDAARMRDKLQGVR
jgi:hypothetical protein